MALKKFKPKNLDEYVELKPGIWARIDRVDVPISKVLPKKKSKGGS